MSDIHVTAADLRKLASALERYQTKVTEETRAVHRALDAANWHDRKKDQFTARYRDFERQVNRFLSGEVQQMTKSLNELARQVEQLKGMRM